jgi:hypothetical protein
MVRVCFSMLLLMILLSGCTTGNPKAAVNAQQADIPSPGENILACTGLPIAGQKCGLAFPKP